MTATTSRGVKCGNCGCYHPSAIDVKNCYGFVQCAPPTVRETAELPADAPPSTWRKNNAAESPFVRPPATERQLNFIRTLREERGLDVDAPIGDKFAASELINELKKMPVVGVNSVGPEPYPDVPAGHYAFKSLTGSNDLDFFRVDRPIEGRWAGRTFVKRVVGGHPDIALRGAEARKVLETLHSLGEALQQAARERYGREIGRCYRCNRTLTDETSRALGIGPDCRERL